jgi:hypothetical protein
MPYLQKATRKLASIFVLAVIIFLFTPSITALADAGPHPIMDFELRYKVDSALVKNAKLIICKGVTCEESWQATFPFGCVQNSCRTLYGDSEYYKLVIEFSDKTRESNVFHKTRYSSSFIVTVNQDDLQVTEMWSSLPYNLNDQALLFLVALAITLPSELFVAYVFFRVKDRPYKKMPIVIASLISLPVVWFVIPFLKLDVYIALLLGELFAFLFEAWYLHKRIENISYGTSLWLSLFMNLTSFFLANILMARSLV